MFNVLEFSGLLLGCGLLGLGDDHYPGWHDVASQYFYETSASRFVFTCISARKMNLRSFSGCVCVYLTRMSGNNTATYVSNMPHSCQKNVNKNARAMAGTLAG